MSKFIKGMDISMVKELEQYGASYRLNGKKEESVCNFKDMRNQ
mgnify:CR=1 FL=1